jgi:hypothetical protein
MMSSCTSVRGVDELDDGGIEDAAIAGVAAQARRHQQDGRPHALAAAHLHVLPIWGISSTRDSR